MKSSKLLFALTFIGLFLGLSLVSSSIINLALNDSTDLIAGYFTDYTAVDDDTAPTAVHTADTVKFLFIQNTHATTSVYINIAAGTAAAAAGNIYVGPGESWYARLSLTTVAAVHAITSTGTADCIVAALLDDVA